MGALTTPRFVLTKRGSREVEDDGDDGGEDNEEVEAEGGRERERGVP